MRPSGVGVADPPPESHPGPLRSPAPGQPDPALPGGRGEDGARRQQPLPGTRRQPHSRTAFGANSSRRRSTAGVGGTPRRAQGQAQPCLGWRGPGAGCNAQGLPPRDPGLSGTRWVLRSGTGLSPRSAPFSRPGWAGLHHRDITSIQDVYRAPAALQATPSWKESLESSGHTWKLFASHFHSTRDWKSTGKVPQGHTHSEGSWEESFLPLPTAESWHPSKCPASHSSAH
ncbi:uncharacterized protein [Castor canadensis]|uniref:Uncharacterized protein n=1 Tax=Castor canadensis TaxID=51338 RepID=A0AC58K8T0_CASCN